MLVSQMNIVEVLYLLERQTMIGMTVDFRKMTEMGFFSTPNLLLPNDPKVK